MPEHGRTVGRVCAGEYSDTSHIHFTRKIVARMSMLTAILSRQVLDMVKVRGGHLGKQVSCAARYQSTPPAQPVNILTAIGQQSPKSVPEPGALGNAKVTTSINIRRVPRHMSSGTRHGHRLNNNMIQGLP